MAKKTKTDKKKKEEEEEEEIVVSPSAADDDKKKSKKKDKKTNKKSSKEKDDKPKKPASKSKKKKKKAEVSSSSSEDSDDNDEEEEKTTKSKKSAASKASKSAASKAGSKSSPSKKKKGGYGQLNSDDDDEPLVDDDDDDSRSHSRSTRSFSSRASRKGGYGALESGSDDEDILEDLESTLPKEKRKKGNLPTTGTDLEELQTDELMNVQMAKYVAPGSTKSSNAHLLHANREWVPLEEDLYNLMFLNGCGWVLIISLFFISCQLGICAMFYYDLWFRNSTRLGIPSQVDLAVTWAQFVALPLAIMSHKESVRSWNQVFMIHVMPTSDRNRGGTKLAWVSTAFFRFFSGFALTALTFTLIVSSTTVPLVFLNAQTVVLVGMIDDVAYWLAQRGFLGKLMEAATDVVPTISMPLRTSPAARAVKILSVLAIWCSLIGLWFMIFNQQISGQFLLEDSCKTWTARFGDWPAPIDEFILTSNLNPEASFFADTTVQYAENADIYKFFPGTAIGGAFNWINKTSISLDYSHLSGTYLVSTQSNGKPELVNSRLLYYEDRGSGQDGTSDSTIGRFSYCEQGGAWVFTIDAISSRIPNRSPDPEEDCPGWLLRSAPTEAFSLDDVPSDGWLVWTGNNGIEEAQNLDLECNECFDTSDCNFNGECVLEDGASEGQGTCACNDGFEGLTCEWEVPCNSFDVQGIGISTATGGTDPLELGTYRVIKVDGTEAADANAADVLRINGRPVYSQRQTCPVADNAHSVGFFFFSSERWYHGSWKGKDFCAYAALKDFPDHAIWGGLLSSPLHFASNKQRQSGSPTKDIPLEWEAYFGRDLVDVDLSVQCSATT